MEIKQNWEKKLIIEARKLVRHKGGSINFCVINENKYFKIIIKAGQWWYFKENLN